MCAKNRIYGRKPVFLHVPYRPAFLISLYGTGNGKFYINTAVYCTAVTVVITFLLVTLSQRLGCLCGIYFVDNARHILPADKIVSLVRDVETKCAALSDDIVHGRSLLELGKALWEAKQWQEALHYIDRARTIFKAVESPLYLGLTYRWISLVHDCSRTRWMPWRRHGSISK